MKSNTGLLLVAGAIGLYLLSRGGALGSLVFLPKGLTPMGGGLRIVVGVQNPTNTPLTLSSMAGTLNVNGSAFGNISDFTPQIIAANSETDVPLLFSPNFFGIASDLLSAVEDGSTAISATLTGTANVNSLSLPLNITFS